MERLTVGSQIASPQHGSALRSACVGAGIGVAVVLGALVILFSLFLVHVQASTRDIQAVPVVNAMSTTWHNGDLILTQHHAFHLATIPVLCRMTVHVGLVWVHPTFGPCIVDTHEAHRQHEQMPDVFTNTRPRAGTRVVRLADYIKEYDGIVLRRPVVRGAVNGAALADAIENWALYQPFDHWVSHAQPMYLAAIGISSAMPRTAQWLARLPGPSHDTHKHRLRGVYCTELAAKLLQRVGALDPAYHSHVCSPLAFTSACGQIDRAAAPYGIAWGPEQRVVHADADADADAADADA